MKPARVVRVVVELARLQLPGILLTERGQQDESLLRSLSSPFARGGSQYGCLTGAVM